MIETLLAILIFVIVAAIILWLVRLIVSNLPVSPTIQNVIIAITALILLLVFVRQQGWWAS
jgi:chromate transport protein ChrA